MLRYDTVQPSQASTRRWVELCLRFPRGCGYKICLLDQKVRVLSTYPEGSLLAAITATENKFELVGTLKCCISVENASCLEGNAGGITRVIKPSDCRLNAKYQCFWYLLIDLRFHAPTL